MENREHQERQNSLKTPCAMLHHIFTNPFYAGKIRSKFLGEEIIDGVHEPAISYTQFFSVSRRDIMG